MLVEITHEHDNTPSSAFLVFNPVKFVYIGENKLPL